MKQLSTSNRLILLVAVLASLLVGVGCVGLVGIYKTNDALQRVYADRTVPMWQLSEVQRLMQRTWLVIAVGQEFRDPGTIDKYLADADANLDTVNQLYGQYLQTGMTPEEEVLAQAFQKDLRRFQDEGLRPALAAWRANRLDEVRRMQTEVMIPLSVPYRERLQALSKLQLEVANEEYQDARTRFNYILLAAFASMLGGLGFAVFFGRFLVRSIVKSNAEFEQSLMAKRDLERQLQQSQKAQALGQLTGGIAHDFNNILTAILGYAKLALDKHVPDKESKLARYLREVIASSERARDLVAKMLSFTRTQPSDNVRLIQPTTVVREVESMLSHAISSSMELRCHIDDETPILMDASELNQMLVNLVINARDAIQTHGQDHGRITISVRRTAVDNQISLTSQRRISGQFLAIEVADTGTGIPVEVLPRIFDPFFTTKDVGKGTGLGLSMVQGIMTRAGGHVLVSTALGRGTRFELLFPLQG